MLISPFKYHCQYGTKPASISLQFTLLIQFGHLDDVYPQMNYSQISDAIPPAQADHFPARFAFSIHKGGSTLMFNMIRDACAATNVPAISFPDLFFREGIFDHEWRNDRQLLEYVVPGRIYYGFRYLPEVLRDPVVQLRHRKSVLLVRDPRDALVSQYYSWGRHDKSHRLPDKNQEKWQSALNGAGQLSIDDYVLQSAPMYLKRFTVYQEHLFSDNLLLRRYEEVYYDKQRFLRDIFGHLQLAVDDTVISQVAARHDIRPTEEDPSNHIRQGAPGDHRRKLRPETINRLNNQFRDVCRGYGYDLGG